MLMQDGLKSDVSLLQKMMLIQEGILISIFFCSLLTMIIADRIFRKLKYKPPVAPQMIVNDKKGKGGVS